MTEQIATLPAQLTLEQRIARLEAKNAVENLMGRYEFFHSANMHTECEDLFAMQTESTRVEMMSGVYEGPEGVHRCYSIFHAHADRDPMGVLHIHTLTTQVIEVAEDGQTARGVWVSPGCETGPEAPSAPPTEYDPDAEIVPGPLKARWAWCKYGCDFILENGVWKIWHLHVFGIFMTPYETSWVEGSMDETSLPPLPPGVGPDRPATTRWIYAPDAMPAYEPVAPAPYRTFADVTDPF